MQFSITHKICPICKLKKPIEDFDKYFSKPRNKFRIQNYCKECQKPNAKKRAKEYYQKNIEERKQYARNYRANPNNREKLRKIKRYFHRKDRAEMKDYQIRAEMVQRLKFKNKDLLENPELVQVYKSRKILRKTLKNYTNGKK